MLGLDSKLKVPKERALEGRIKDYNNSADGRKVNAEKKMGDGAIQGGRKETGRKNDDVKHAFGKKVQKAGGKQERPQ